jgi:Tfp pilus assembly protein PilX
MAVTRRTPAARAAHAQAPSSRRGRRARGGFTLVSMIVAIVLLTVGLMALAQANTNTIKTQTSAQNRTTALAIARAYLEDVRSRDPWSVQTESSVTVGPDGEPSASGRFVRSLKVTQERQNLLAVELTVDYPRAQSPVRVRTNLYRGSGLAAASGSAP